MVKNDVSILVIDDEEDVRRSLVLLLETNGFSNVESADGAKEGIRKAASKAYDLIILDMIMPKVSGWGVLQEIAAKKIKTRVLVVSAVGLPEVVKTEIKSRYPSVGFIPKTDAAAGLIGKIKEAMAEPAGTIL